MLYRHLLLCLLIGCGLSISASSHDVNGMDIDWIFVGAHAYFDPKAAAAPSHQVNASGGLSVELEAVNHISSYNDYREVADKSSALLASLISIGGRLL